MEFFRGLKYAILPSIALWALAILLVRLGTMML
jgi:uncharacterized membrane protein